MLLIQHTLSNETYDYLIEYSFYHYRLLINFSSDKSQPLWLGLTFTALLFILAVVRSLLLQQYFHRCFTAGMRLKTAVTWAVYRKVKNIVIVF